MTKNLRVNKTKITFRNLRGAEKFWTERLKGYITTTFTLVVYIKPTVL